MISIYIYILSLSFHIYIYTIYPISVRYIYIMLLLFAHLFFWPLCFRSRLGSMCWSYCSFWWSCVDSCDEKVKKSAAAAVSLDWFTGKKQPENPIVQGKNHGFRFRFYMKHPKFHAIHPIHPIICRVIHVNQLRLGQISLDFHGRFS